MKPIPPIKIQQQPAHPSQLDPSWRIGRLLWAPHRLGFFVAACVMLVAAMWWAVEMAWRVSPLGPLHHASVATYSHALIMSLGFLP